MEYDHVKPKFAWELPKNKMVELKKKIEDLMKDNQIPFKITIYMLK